MVTLAPEQYNDPYYLKPGESVADYNARVVGKTGGENLATAKTPAPVTRYTGLAGGTGLTNGDGTPYSTGSSAASSSPGTPTVSRYTSAADSAFSSGGVFDATKKEYSPQDEQKIRDQQRQLVQAQIDMINESSNQELAKARQVEKGQQGANRARLSATGQLGSGGETTSINGISDREKDVEKSIFAERDAKVSSILSGVETRSQDLIDKQKTSARENQSAYLEHLSKSSDAARKDMLELGKVGADLSDEQRRALIDQTGYDENSFDQLYKSYKIANSDEYLNKGNPEIVGNKAVFFKQSKDPKTGALTLTSDTIELPVDANIDPKNIEVISRDDGIYVLNKLDGTYKKVGQPSASLVKANADARGAAANTDQLYSGLSTPTATAVRARVNKFSSDPTIQNFATVQDGYNFAKSLDTNTQNPADDQALIYSLAKALDPGSVVREGEYATAQKYAQSWVSAFGTGVNQALLGTGFLSKSARENIKKTIEQKYNAQKRSYDQTNKSYTEGINSLTGRKDGSKFLVDYVTPEQDSKAGGDISSRAATAGYDYEAMIKAGYTDADIAAALDKQGK